MNIATWGVPAKVCGIPSIIRKCPPQKTDDTIKEEVGYGVLQPYFFVNSGVRYAQVRKKKMTISQQSMFRVLFLVWLQS